MSKSSLIKFAVIVCVTFYALGSQSQAQVIVLTDNNSSALIDTGGQAGMFNWSVDGQNQLFQQWFWYRVGAVGPEASINTISAPTIVIPDPRTLYTSYGNAQFGIEVDYMLTGQAPGSGISDIDESITIRNLTASPLDFHLFQYSDFDLLGSPGNDVVQLGRNLSGLFNEAHQTDGNVAFSETVNTPGAQHGEVALFATTLNELNDGAATTLNDNAGPVGPGDVTWALEWNLTIAPGSSVGISKDKYLQLIPEPSTVTLLALGLVGFLAASRRKK